MRDGCGRDSRRNQEPSEGEQQQSTEEVAVHLRGSRGKSASPSALVECSGQSPRHGASPGTGRVPDSKPAGAEPPQISVRSGRDSVHQHSQGRLRYQLNEQSAGESKQTAATTEFKVI